MKKVKEIIQVRFKPLKDGRKSIYFDIYKDGKRTYEFLKMYLLPKSAFMYIDKNRMTLKKVEEIKAKRILDIQESGETTKPLTTSEAIGVFLQERARTIKPSSIDSYKVCLDRWYKFGSEDTPINDISVEMLQDYSAYLSSHFKYGTARLSFSVFGVMLTMMYKKGYLKTNPVYKLESAYKPKGKTKDIAFLTLDELVRFAAVESWHPIKNAFLFSCFTGLRYSDILQLKWSDIVNGSIVKTQQKTGDIVRIPLSENAKRWMPERNGDLVFNLDKSKVAYAKAIKVLARMAKIDKDITFHSARHTFATLALNYGADLYTVSKLLGHRDILTTQKYAEVIDKTKEDAVNLIPKI